MSEPGDEILFEPNVLIFGGDHTLWSWRGRIVGVSCDPETLFMSQVGDPNNYDYAPPSEPDPDHVIQKPSESEAG